MVGPLQTIHSPMRRFRDDEEVDYVVVGVGSAGGVLVQRLARAGFNVVGIESGPFWDTERDWVSDEVGSHKLYWTDPRVTGGTDPLALGANNCGQGVGGGSVHWAAFTPRLHPSDFEVYTRDGVGVDWPIDVCRHQTLLRATRAGDARGWPGLLSLGTSARLRLRPAPDGRRRQHAHQGLHRAEHPRVRSAAPLRFSPARTATGPHCIYRGFCIQGCKVGAKASTLVTHVPDAVVKGAEIRSLSMVSRVELGKDNRVTGVHYIDRDAKSHFQKAKAVIISGYAIETPRLLLNSACPGHEDGLANSSGVLGKYLMAQAGNVVMGRFDEPVRMYKAPPAHALTEEFYETDPKNDFARGYAIQTVGPLPVAFGKQMLAAKQAWGWGLRKEMMDYNHWSAFGLLGEILPWEDNTVTLSDDKDRFGLKVAHVTFNLHENDKKLIKAARKKTEEVMEAAGATEVAQEARYAHLVGACRMGSDPRSSVVDKFGRTHDIANLFVCDGSVFPTQGSANPGLTIQALAARTADYLVREGDGIFHSNSRDMTTPPMRPELAPPATWGKGVPRLK